MERLFEYSNKLINEVSTGFLRYMHSEINWKGRMIGLIGPRGVGKTTLVLQYIKQNLNPSETLYITAEDFYFVDNRIIELVDRFVKFGGKYLFIDEIHKYKHWSKELKLIYDYHKDLKVVFTGSSVLDIKKGASDLSRRAVVYNMQGLSFREYLKLFHNISANTYTLDEILDHKVDVPEMERPLPLYVDYLKRGYYPFALEEDFDIRLAQIINQTLENDIPIYADMNVATGRKLKQLLSIISKSAPLVRHDVFASPVADFSVDDKTFEVGGKSKGQKQIKDIENGYVVKDDIEQGFLNVIPLWQLGLTY